MKINTFTAEYNEYAQVMAAEAREAYFAAQNICMSCDGFGDHGVEEETGCLYVCYGCGGTGKYNEGVTR